jgi:hypothetical protein
MLLWALRPGRASDGTLGPFFDAIGDRKIQEDVERVCRGKVAIKEEEGRVMNKFSTFMFCREDVLRLGKRVLAFSPAKWNRRYIINHSFMAAVRALRRRFHREFDICEEYCLREGESGRLEILYRIIILGETGEIGFLFQIKIFDAEDGISWREEARGSAPKDERRINRFLY